MTTLPEPVSSLTKFSSAGIAEVFTLSVPLMLASLSGLLMNFCDRVILAHYSTDAMNAAVTAGMTAGVFTYGALGIALIAEVFVGKNNGAGRFADVAKPVWQMMWFSVATFAVFIPCAIFFAPFIVPLEQFHGQATSYFKIWMWFGPAFPLAGALSAFFIGIGSVRIVTMATLLSNLLNIVLDVILVFGVGDTISPMGVEGAALATGIAQLSQVVILFVAFLSREHRRRYETSSCGFDRTLFMDCIKLGSPGAIGHMIEIAAWAVILRMMANESEAHITTLSVGQNLIILFAFATQGLQKAIVSIAANLIGMNAQALTSRLITSALVMLFTIVAILFLPLVAFPKTLISVFFSHDIADLSDVLAIATPIGICVWSYFLLDGIVWIMAGVLTAYSDTKFIMMANATCAWCFAVVPTYVFIVVMKYPPIYSLLLMSTYAFVNGLLFTTRMRKVTRRSII